MGGTSTPRMPRDFDQRLHGGAIQVLEPTGTVGRMTVTDAGSLRVGPFPLGSVVSIWSEITCFFRLGNGAVVASVGSDSDPLTAQQREFYNMGDNTHIAAIGFPATGS